jgi:hypothetical protein
VIDTTDQPVTEPRPGPRGRGRPRVVGARLVGAVLLVLSASALVACGDDGADGEVTSAATSATTEAVTTTEADAYAEETSATPGGAAVCADVEAIRASVETMQDATVGDGALVVVAEEVLAVEAASQALRADATEEYQDEVDDVQTAVDELRASVDAAQADASAAGLREVTAGVRTLADTVQALVDDVEATC